MREVACHKYTTPYDIDLDAMDDHRSSQMGPAGRNNARHMSV
jgi:hypothetical protein